MYGACLCRWIVHHRWRWRWYIYIHGISHLIDSTSKENKGKGSLLGWQVRSRYFGRAFWVNLGNKFAEFLIFINQVTLFGIEFSLSLFSSHGSLFLIVSLLSLVFVPPPQVTLVLEQRKYFFALKLLDILRALSSIQKNTLLTFCRIQAHKC